jgi:hypothetical protein
MIETYKSLAVALGGLFKVDSLAVMSATNRLPLSRQYIGGHRVFDPIEVEAFKSEVLARRANRKGAK